MSADCDDDYGGQRYNLAKVEEARSTKRMKFDDWIEKLDTEVIQGEYGYADGEFAVYPGQWRPLWHEGLTPAEAFKRALDAFAEVLAERDREREKNYKRTQAEHAKYATGPLIAK